jgi:hypothetical protein
MSVLLTEAQIVARRAVASGPLISLSDSLARDLEAVLARDLFIPAEKARMTRRGGRCEVDGTMLEFDPFSPRLHRCPRCGNVFDDESHYRWWIMGYQLWLAERAVHAASLFALRGDARHGDFARGVLEGYAGRYLSYPNKDNVLGPTRVFFSTYLESIWLLQLVVALDLLERTAGGSPLGDLVRDRLVRPSLELIGGYDEGLSNRQVWNNAAMLAAARLLDGRVHEPALVGPSGLVSHLTHGLLADGTWYEGENYHLFAHRGLWYGVTIAMNAGAVLDASLLTRFDEAFATPFVSALPDFTFPSRRDSQYAVSLRQWRFAELAELGIVRQPSDARLRGALATLYDGAGPRRATGRSRSTAEAERNFPATSLDRSDLGWRSLLFATPELPSLTQSPPRSALLADQGYAILRRDDGQLYAALDYGHSGSGHGHPDRLNFVLMRGADRWLDDVGTGSYVDPSLHWYRSTLAHNAPLVNGRSQKRVHGELVAFEERETVGWVRARVEGAAPGVRLARAIVAMEHYIVDELSWDADHPVQLDLPLHADGEVAAIGPWTEATPAGSLELEDGFRYLTDAQTAGGHVDRVVRLQARLGQSVADAYVTATTPHHWWRATSIGAPGSGTARFHFIRATAVAGKIRTVWDVCGVVASVSGTDDGVSVLLRDGSRHDHMSGSLRWRVEIDRNRSIELGGAVSRRIMMPAPPRAEDAPRAIPRAATSALRFTLGEAQYRRSEDSWSEAGRPTATVSIAVDRDQLAIVIDVSKSDLHFAGEVRANLLDNENPDTNSDGIQLHMVLPTLSDATTSTRNVDWLIVPDAATDRVRVTARASAEKAPAMHAGWQRTPTGYEVRCSFATADLGVRVGTPFRLGVMVNETSPDRERRRGQLVLGGSEGQFVYLRGDRHSAEDQLAFVIGDG